MAARCVWDAEERFEFDILDQWSIPLAFHEYLPIILGSPKNGAVGRSKPSYIMRVRQVVNGIWL